LGFFWGDRRWDFWGYFGGVESDGESWHRGGESTAAMSGSFHFFLSSMLPAFAGRQAPGSMSGDMYWIPGQARNDVDVGLVVEVYGLFRRSGFRVKPGMTCKTLAGRAEHTSSRTSPSPRGDIDPGSMKGICTGFRVKPGMTWVWGLVVEVYGLFRRSGFRVKPGMTWDGGWD